MNPDVSKLLACGGTDQMNIAGIVNALSDFNVGLAVVVHRGLPIDSLGQIGIGIDFPRPLFDQNESIRLSESEPVTARAALHKLAHDPFTAFIQYVGL